MFTKPSRQANQEFAQQKQSPIKINNEQADAEMSEDATAADKLSEHNHAVVDIFNEQILQHNIFDTIPI